MSKRHNNALYIQMGAVNPSAVAASIVAACAEIREEPDYRGTDHIKQDPAVRLMVHQLAFLCNVDFDLHGDYSRAAAECKAKATDPNLTSED